MTSRLLGGWLCRICVPAHQGRHLQRPRQLFRSHHLHGAVVNLSLPQKPLSISAVSLLNNRRSIAGTRSGGLRETQEMIDFCAEHGIGAEVEVIDADRIDEAYQRLLAGDVRFRFVIDISTMARG